MTKLSPVEQKFVLHWGEMGTRWGINRTVAQIARQLIHELLHRDGLVHRRCVLVVDPAAIDRLVDEGYHPQLGARALKRCVERQLTQRG